MDCWLSLWVHLHRHVWGECKERKGKQKNYKLGKGNSYPRLSIVAEEPEINWRKAKSNWNLGRRKQHVLPTILSTLDPGLKQRWDGDRELPRPQSHLHFGVRGWRGYRTVNSVALDTKITAEWTAVNNNFGGQHFINSQNDYILPRSHS